jgi:hypothetical protein
MGPISGTALADVTLDYDSTFYIAGKETKHATFWLARGKVALKSICAQPMRAIYWADKDLMAIINDEEKSYIEITGKDLEALGAQIAGVADQMTQVMSAMPPEQRAMIEQHLKKTQSAAPAGKPEIKVLPTPDTKTLQGYECRRYEIANHGVKKAEVWATAAGEKTVTPEEMTGITGMVDLLQRFFDALGSMSGSMGIEMPASTGLSKDVGGVPVVAKDLDGDKVKSEMSLQALKRGPIPKETFEVPKGYRKQDFGPMGKE